jgi:pilus assembly protein CpaB
MRPKSLILLALALGCGLVASIGISQVLEGNRPVAVETSPIYVALQNINVGDPLTDKMVSLEEWPKDKVPVGAIAKWEDLESRRPRTNIYQGEPILDGKLLAKGQTNDPIQGVPTGMRLKTVEVNASKSAAGLLSPGDRVDVQLYVARNETYGVTSSQTRIIMQNVRVYAVDQTIEKASDGEDARNVAKTVSLIVTPAQANKITLAENLGQVSLIPRHPDDEGVVEDAEQSAEDLLNPSSANSRRREQLADKDKKDDSAFAGLKSLVADAMARTAAQAAVPQAVQKPPFQMTIIYPNEIARIRFSPTGEPIDGDEKTEPGALTNVMTSAAAPAAAPAAEPAAQPTTPVDEPKTPADFPIDLKLK